jgi:hypothetical protein
MCDKESYQWQEKRHNSCDCKCVKAVAYKW